MKGTPSRKAEPHQKCWSSTPPTSGPTAMPPMKQLNHTPIAVIIARSVVKIVRNRPIVEGISVAPAMPRTARQKMSCSGVVA